MSATVTTGELRNMQLQELKREAESCRLEAAKLSIHVKMRSEKDTAKERRKRRELARLLTIIHEKEKELPLKKDRKKGKLSASTSS